MFHKVMFSNSAHGTTAGLVVNTDTINVGDMSAVSRLFPLSEFRKMTRYHVSPAFATWDDAFAYVFPVDIVGNDARPVTYADRAYDSPAERRKADRAESRARNRR